MLVRYGIIVLTTQCCWPCMGSLFPSQCCWPTKAWDHTLAYYSYNSSTDLLNAWDNASAHCSYYSTVDLLIRHETMHWFTVSYYSTVDLLLRHKTTHQLTVPIIALLTYLKAQDHPLAHVPISALLTYHLAWDQSTGCWVPGELHPPLLPAGPASTLAALSAARSASWPTGPGTRQGSEDSNHNNINKREFIQRFQRLNVFDNFNRRKAWNTWKVTLRKK